MLAAAREGAPWAWEHLYRLLSPAVASYLRLQGAHDVDDSTSEMFLGVVRGIAGFAGSEAQFRSWVFVIAQRRVQDERRRLARRGVDARLHEVEPPPGGDAEDDALRTLATARVTALCERLAPD